MSYIAEKALAPDGYEWFNGYLVNKSTGEIVEDYDLCFLPPGSSFQTPEDKERNRKAKQQREEHERDYRRDKGERFCFVRSDAGFGNLSPSMITKLIYLNTFARFEDNALMKTQRTRMERVDLQDILRVSKGTAYNFWHETVPEYIAESESGLLVMNADRFRRGCMKKKKYIPYQQFYDNGVRSLYEASDSKYHKQLGYLFQLLPYINREYNILCHNPEETDDKLVEPMTLAEFCEAIDHDKSNVSKLLKIYDAVRFNVNGIQERFCTLTYNGLDRQTAKIIINPAILYAGSNQNRVDIMNLYFKDL